MKKLFFWCFTLLCTVFLWSSVFAQLQNVSWSASDYTSWATATYTFSFDTPRSDRSYYLSSEIHFPVEFVYSGLNIYDDITVSISWSSFIPNTIDFDPLFELISLDNWSDSIIPWGVPVTITISNIINPSAWVYNWASEFFFLGEWDDSVALSDITIVDTEVVPLEYPLCTLEDGVEWYYFFDEDQTLKQWYFSWYDANDNPIFVLDSWEWFILLYFSWSQWVIGNDWWAIFATSDTIYWEYTPSQLWINRWYWAIGIGWCEDGEENNEMLWCIDYSGSPFLWAVILNPDGTVIGCDDLANVDQDLIPGWSWYWNAMYSSPSDEFEFGYPDYFTPRLWWACDDCYIAADSLWWWDDDEAWTVAVPFGFSINYYGSTYDGVFIWSNGSVTFDAWSSEYDEPLENILWYGPGICVYCIDLENGWQLGETFDTRGTGRHADFFYRWRTTVDGRPAFVVTWMNMSQYDSYDPFNTFQLVFVDVSDANDDVDIILNYGSITDAGEDNQWYCLDEEEEDCWLVAIWLGLSVGDELIYNSLINDDDELLNGLLMSELADGWTHALRSNHLNSVIDGRYKFSMINGVLPGSAIVNLHEWPPGTNNSLLIDDFESYSGNGLWYTDGWYGGRWYGDAEYYGGWPYGEEVSDTYWVADCDVSYEGDCSSTAVVYGDNTVAENTKTIILSTSGYIGFWVKTSSEEGYDGVSFWINGINQQMGVNYCDIDLDVKWWLTFLSADWLYEEWTCPFYFVSGETDRTFYSFPIASGQNIITFLYTKDTSGSEWDDTVWVDDVMFYYNDDQEEEVTPPTWWGGGGWSISTDSCPNEDNSGSYYDGKCDGNNPQTKPNPVKLPKLKLNQIEKKKPLEFCKYNDTKWVSAAFTDVVWTPYASAVWVLVSHCLVQGYNNNGQDFGINDPLKRGELYKVFTRMALLDFDLNHPWLWWSHGYKIAGETVWLWNLLSMTKDQSALVTQQELLQVTMNYLAYMWVLDEAPAFTFWNKQVARGEFAKFINTVLGLVSTK